MATQPAADGGAAASGSTAAAAGVRAAPSPASTAAAAGVRAAPSPASTAAAAGVRAVAPPAVVDAAAAGPAQARLVIAVTPAGAHVSVDGVEMGAAPVTLERAAGTEVTVRASKRGYEATTRTVTVGAAPRLDLALKRHHSRKRTHHDRATERPDNWGRPGGSLEDLVKP